MPKHTEYIAEIYKFTYRKVYPDGQQLVGSFTSGFKDISDAIYFGKRQIDIYIGTPHWQVQLEGKKLSEIF